MALKLLQLCFWIGIGVLFFFPINASDFYHHLNTGRDIWQHHALPYSDTYSFTAFGKPWVAYAWGTGLIYYLLYSTLGHIGISLFTAGVGVGTIWFFYQTAKKLDVPLVLSYPISALMATLLSVRWPTRPEILSPFFISICLYLLIKKHSLTLLCIPVFFLWGVLYGSSAFLGVCILLLFILLLSTRKIRDLGIAVVSAIASGMNGYGLSGFFYIFQIPSIAAHTGEWLPILETINPVRPELALFYQWQVVCYGVFTLLVLAAILITLSKKQKTATQWFALVLAVAILAPYKSVRFLNLSPILAAPLLCMILSTAQSRKLRIVAVGISVLAICVAVVRFATYAVGTGEEFTKKPMQFLKSKGISGNIMSLQEMGAHISWELPDSKILYDTRDDLYQPTGIFEEVRRLDEGKIPIESFVQKHNISIIIADLNTGPVYKPLLYSDNWGLIFTTDGYFIIVTKQIATAKNLTVFGSVDPLRSPSAKPGALEQAYNELLILESLDPSSIENMVRSADVALALGKTDEAKRVLKSLPFPSSFGVRSAVDMVSSGQLLGTYAMETGDCVRAKSLFALSAKKRMHALIFSRDTILPNSIDRSLGQYYQRCENNKEKAKEYYMKFMNSSTKPLEKRSVEQLILAL